MYRDSLKPKTTYPSHLARHLSATYFPKSATSVLDIGAGRGELVQELASIGYNCTALDDPKLSLDSRIPGVQRVWEAFDKNSFESTSQTFDVVILKSVIEHMSDPVGLLVKASRLLSDEGRILVLTPDWVRNKSRFYDDHTHIVPFTRRSLMNAMLVAGLYGPTVDYLIPLPRTWRHPMLARASQIIGPLVPPSVEWRPLRWSRERQLLGIAARRKAS